MREHKKILEWRRTTPDDTRTHFSASDIMRCSSQRTVINWHSSASLKMPWDIRVRRDWVTMLTFYVTSGDGTVEAGEQRGECHRVRWMREAVSRGHGGDGSTEGSWYPLLRLTNMPVPLRDLALSIAISYSGGEWNKKDGEKSDRMSEPYRGTK